VKRITSKPQAINPSHDGIQQLKVAFLLMLIAVNDLELVMAILEYI
jgi:hypothetical protein